MQQVEDAIRRIKGRNPERYARIWRHMLDGCPAKVIGIREHVSKNRAANLIADTRKALRAAAREVKDAVLVLRFVSEEPYSTIEDILEARTVPIVKGEKPPLREVETNLKKLVRSLVSTKRLEVHEKGSYCVTESGTSFLRGRRVVGGTDVMEDIGAHVNL
jgi:hypothetical protein